MALSNAVAGARHTSQRITWTDGDGDPLNLIGATLTGRIKSQDGGAAAAITGTLTIVDGEAGIFDWAYGATDVATAGAYHVQFVATYGAAPNTTTDKTIIESWVVEEAI